MASGSKDIPEISTFWPPFTQQKEKKVLEIVRFMLYTTPLCSRANG